MGGPRTVEANAVVAQSLYGKDEVFGARSRRTLARVPRAVEPGKHSDRHRFTVQPERTYAASTPPFTPVM